MDGAGFWWIMNHILNEIENLLFLPASSNGLGGKGVSNEAPIIRARVISTHA
jgi:hypothetical protein